MTDYDVRLEGVTKQFDDVTAVDDVDLRVESGEFLTLLGPSGCGKTTLLRCIDGFETPTAGAVYIKDEDVTHVPPFERNTSMVFQSYALFPHMTVGENVAFGLQMQGVDGSGEAGRGGVGRSLKRLVRRGTNEEIETRVEEMLELVELPGTKDRQVSELSGGQQQRIALARALITEPAVLLLDEPLGALDLKLRQNMQVELKNLQEELNTTFVYVTHDQEEALTMSDQIAVMNDGHVEQLGTATEIYEEPATEFVADFIGETNLVRGDYSETTEGATIRRNGRSYRVPKNPDAGASAGFAVRPEKIRIGDEAAGLDNSFTAAIIDEIYKGNLGKFVVQLDDGERFTVDMQIRDQGSYLQTGETVQIGWAAENSVVLTE
jgi:spermidine/putrescine transport system ATP-binding protein